MMSTTAEKSATTPIPVQLSEPEFTAFILPHLSMLKRGPKCKLGYHRVFNLILWVLYTGMPWKCLPVPKDTNRQPAIHYTTVYKVFAKWADDRSLQQAFMASVAHLSDEKKLDLRVLHGDGTNTVAKKGAMASATRATSTRRGKRSSPSRTTRAIARPPSEAGSGCSMPRSMRYARKWSGPLHGRINSSGCCCGLNASSSGTMA
jgi:transposase